MQRPLRRSRSFKVIDLGTNRKLIYDFLLLINTNLHPVSHFPSYSVGQIFAFDSTLLQGEPLNAGPQNLASKNSALSYGVAY